MDREVKDGHVAYVAGTAQMPAPAVSAGMFAESDPRAEARAASFQEHLAASDEEVRSLIWANPQVFHGAPVIKGTRIPVFFILSLIEEGYSVAQMLKLYPHVTEAQVRAAIRFAAVVLEAQSDRTE